MEETKMSASPGKEGVEGTDGMGCVWLEKLGKDSYKSFSKLGEVYALGDCVRCFVESGESRVGKIIKLFQLGDRKMCRIRRFYKYTELALGVQGLEDPIDRKEVFLASGDGPGVQDDLLLEGIVNRIIILCTVVHEFNLMPSSEQIDNAENFFHRGYDPASNEVVGLDTVVEELGAQKVLNKSSWLGDKVPGLSSSQISASRIHAQSPASGSSSHQGAATAMYSSVPEVSPAPSRDSTERKLKKRKSDNLAPEQHKVDAVEKRNEFHAPKKPKVGKSTMPTEKSNASSDRVVFALPAPAMSNLIREDVSPRSAKPPTSSMPKSKPIQREGKGEILKSSSSPTALVGSKQAEVKVGGIKKAERKKKDGEMPSGGTVKRIVKPGEKSNAPSGRENPSKLQRRSDEGIVMPASLGSKQAEAKVGGISSEGKRKDGEMPSGGTVKRIVKLGDRLNPSPGNPSKLMKRPDDGMRKVPSAPSSLAKKAPHLTVKIPTANPSAMKAGTSVSNASPEAVKTDVGSRVLKRDEDVAHAPSTSQRQSGSQVLNMSARKGSTPTPKDPRLLSKSPRESPIEMMSKSLSNRDIEVVNLPGSSPTASAPQKPLGQIFKPKVEDWDSTIAQAIQSNRVLQLKNVDPELHSDELGEVLSAAMKIRCEVRIAPPVSFSYQSTTALLKLPSYKKAEEVQKEIESKNVLVANRLLTATLFSSAEFKGPQILKHHGHLDFAQGRDHLIEDYKNAVATSHLAQGNTIEFAYGLPWRVLDEQHEEQWRMLQMVHHTQMNE